MGLLSKIENRIFGQNSEKRHGQTIDDKVNDSVQASQGVGTGLLFGYGGLFNEDKSMTLSAVYGSISIIAKAVAELPLNVFKMDKDGFKQLYFEHPLYNILTRTPNQRMTMFTLKRLLVQSLYLRGNGYAWIERKGKQVKGIHFIPSEFVTIDDTTLNYLDKPVNYHIVGVDKPVSYKDVIHIINTSYDGVNGISTLKFAYQSLNTAFNAELAASNFYESGNCLGGILKVHSSLTKEQKEEIRKSWNQARSSTGGLNGVALLEANMEYENIACNPKDSQLLESRHHDLDQIARFFNISPLKIGDLSHNSYSTLEMSQLQFLTDTLSPLLKSIEEEFERKLFPDEPDVVIKFDTKQLLRTDKQSQANYYSTLFQLGAITPNEIRKELDMSRIEDGDHTFVQVNVQPLEKATSDNPATSEDIKQALND